MRKQRLKAYSLSWLGGRQRAAKPFTYLVILSVISIGGFFLLSHQAKGLVIFTAGPNSASSTSDCVDNAGTGTVAWTNPGNAFSNNTTYATVSVDGTTSHYIKCTNFGFSIPSSAIVKGIVVGVDRKSSSTNNGGSNDAAMRLVLSGTIQSTDRSTSTTYTTTDTYEDHGGSNDSWGASLTGSDVNSSTFGAAFAATKPNAAGSAHTVSVDHIRITVYYYFKAPLLTQTGYTIENEDGSGVNNDTVQAGSSFSSGQTISSVAKGERMTLRFQVKNTGGITDFSNLGLFYDRGDGIWAKVRGARAPVTGSGNCSSDNNWTCTAVDTTNTVGQFGSLAIGANGNPWISYYDNTNGDLRVANYVGSGGSCSGSSTWNCTAVDTTNTVGAYSSIAIGPNGNPWVSYRDDTGGDLRVAQYLGGTGGGNCGSSAWACTSVDTTNSVGNYTSVAIDTNGNPWVSYFDTTNSDLRVAQYVSSGGTGCASSAWTCTAVDTANLVGQYTSIAFDPSGNPWVSYYDVTNTGLRVAHYVGSGGAGCTSSAWSCFAVDSTNDVGSYSSIAIDPTGTPWVSYYDDSTNFDLRVAKYLNGATTGTGCATNTWTCTAVDSSNSIGSYSSMAFDPGGNAWVSYFDGTNNDLRVARYLSGATTGSGCAVNTWTCASLDTANDVGSYTSIAFDPSGNPWVSYNDLTNGDVKVATVARAGEITMSSGLAGANGDAITSSHADMTSAGDSTNKSDADCISGTWNNGKWFTSPEGVVSIPDGTSTAQCTEVAFTIDTSQAIAGDTYRFMLATNDNWRSDKGRWRGPISVSSGAYPTMTISSTSSPRIAKDSQFTMTACTNTNWGCAAAVTANNVGSYTSLAFDPNGNPWVSYYDNTNGDLRVAQYLGGSTSGTGCAVNTWTCTAVDTANTVGSYTSLAFDPNGNPWVSYFDSTNADLRVAQYLGGSTSGTGCAVNTWTCTAVDTANNVGSFTSLAFDPNGNPWVSYYDSTNLDLRVARYIGSGGSGCAVTSWTCTAVDTANDVGGYNSLAFDPNGNPWVSYLDNTNHDLRVAKYVGAGGAGCAISAWTCTSVDTATNVDQSTSIAFDPSGNPWVSYYDNTNGDLRVAQYLGGSTSGTGCAVNTWTCTAVDTANTVGSYTSLAFDPNGNPWVSYFDSTNADLRVARYIGSGGSGCAVTSWTCTAVDTANDVGEYATIAFDPSGNPWVSYLDNTNSDLRVAKLNLSPAPLTATDLYTYNNGRNAPRSDGRWHLDNGYAPRASSGSCTATTDYLGYCGVGANDGSFDSLSGTNARLIYTYATQSNSPSSIPTITWSGRSNVAPNSSGTTGDIIMQLYNFTNGTWDTVASDTTDSNCSTANCTVKYQYNVKGVSHIDYYQNSSNSFLIYARVWQYENSSSETFKTDYLYIAFDNTGNRLYLGKHFVNGVKSNLKP